MPQKIAKGPKGPTFHNKTPHATNIPEQGGKSGGNRKTAPTGNKMKRGG